MFCNHDQGGGGDANAFFFIFLHIKEAVFFCIFCIFFAFFLHMSCLQFPFNVAIHGQICSADSRWQGGGGQMHVFAFFRIAFFAVSTCIPPPPPRMMLLTPVAQRALSLQHGMRAWVPLVSFVV